MRPDREKIAELLDQIEGELAPSFVEIERYDPSDYISSFCLDHLLDIDPSLFVETKEDPTELFASLSEHSDGLKELFGIIGTEGKIVRFKPEDLIYELLSGPCSTTFYTLESLFFLKGEEDVWCFMMGNNE